MSCDSLFSRNIFCTAPGEAGHGQLDLENTLSEAATVQCGGYPFCAFELLFAELVWVGGMACVQWLCFSASCWSLIMFD